MAKKKAAKKTAGGIKIQPLGDRVVVEREESESVTAGGIVLPDTAKDKPARGVIVSVGDGRMLDDGTRAAFQVKVGDRVLFSSYAGDEFKLGDRELLLEPQATAHTDNDLIVTDTKTDTLFLGDLLFSVHVPTIDGSIKGWLTLLDEMGKRNAARVVPGHGPKTMELPQALEPEQRYLTAVADDVRRQIAEGKTLSKATKTAGFSEKDAWKLFGQYHVRNVTAAFAELEWD